MIDSSTVVVPPERIPNTGNPKEVGGLKITFGLDLDGYQDLQPRDRFNESICGPQALAAASAKAVNRTTPIPSTTTSGATTTSGTPSVVSAFVIVGTLLGGLCFLCFKLAGQVRVQFTGQPIVTTLSSSESQYQEATLQDLRKGATPHRYNLSGFLPE